MKDKKRSERVALVTGGARGIGRNIAQVLGRGGTAVVIVDVNKPLGRAAVSQLLKENISAGFVHADLSRRGAAQSMIRTVVREYGRLDILVNNARSGQRTAMLQESEDTWENGMAVTLKAAFFASQEAVRVMSGAHGGCIVNIGSIAAFMTSHESPVYHVAKAGLMHMTRYLAVQAGPLGVRVNAVMPGFIVQDEHQSRYDARGNQAYRKHAECIHPMKKVGSADDVAHSVAYLCSPEASFVTGQCLVVDGGATLQEQFGLVASLNRKKK